MRQRASMTFKAVRPLLFSLEAERAHSLTIAMLDLWDGLGASGPVQDPVLQTSFAGLTFPNPVGLAAGVDKEAQAYRGFHALGFGSVEVGTLTPLPQPGNPKPRVIRLLDDDAAINRMGFNSGGLDHALVRVANKPRRAPGVLGINVGANKDSENRVADYGIGVTKAAPFADYVSINISSPNTPGLRDLQRGQALGDLLRAADTGRKTPDRRVPLFLKVSPDLEMDAIEDISAQAIENHVDAIIIGNTTITRPDVRSHNRDEVGGLSGPPLAPLARQKLAEFRTVTKDAIPLISAGGVDSAEEAYARIRLGASMVHLYTAMIFEGPGLARRIATGMAELLRRDGFTSVAEAVGRD